MDTLAPVHRKEAARIVEYHPRREWIGYGTVPIIEQDGKFWITDGKGGGKLLPESKVPPELLAYCKANPKTGVEVNQMQVAKTCEHCGQSFLGAAWDEHVMNVIRELTGGGGGSIKIDAIDTGGAEVRDDVPASDRALVEDVQGLD